MHFSIPDTQDQYVDNGASGGGGGNTINAPTYTVYNIYINGNYHCSLRYKQLHALHEQLRRRCSDTALPSFPPKRLLPLTNSQLETRRAALEHYLQIIGQDARIARLPFLQQFLHRAQMNTALAECTVATDTEEQQLEVEVYTQPTGAQLLVNCHVQQNASSMLQTVCRVLHLPAELVQFFCLYLARKTPVDLGGAGGGGGENTNSLLLLRRLMDFESPYITRLHAQPCQLLLRTCYWNPKWDVKLFANPIALDLLYNQTVADVTREWIISTPEVSRQLRQLQRQGSSSSSPLSYLELARQLPSYGCLQFDAAHVDYPDADTTALITIGNKELSLRTARGPKIYETKFRVTRMRCWRVSAMHNTFESRDTPTQLQLAFEYLMSKQTLRWITITSPQAMLMSVCLQAMVDELLNNAGDDLNNSDDDQEATSSSSVAVAAGAATSTYRNGRGTVSTSISSESTSSSASASTSTSTSTSTSNSYSTTTTTATTSMTSANIRPPVKFLAQRMTPTSKQPHKLTTARTFAAVFFRNDDSSSGGGSGGGNNSSSVRNEAFEGIGDDDL